MSLFYDHTLIVPKSAIDGNNHVNNVHYVQWMQDAATAHSALLGFTEEFYKTTEGVWVARSHYIEYLKPAFLGDKIAVRTWISSIKRSISNRKYLFFNANNKSVLARAETVWIYINSKSGRPNKIPDELLEKYVADENYEPEI